MNELINNALADYFDCDIEDLPEILDWSDDVVADVVAALVKSGHKIVWA